MAAKSNYFEDAVLNVLRGVTITAPATIYLALLTADPTDTGTMTSEVAGGGYARQAVAFAAPSDGVSGRRKIANSADVLFPVATGSWGTVTHFAVMDALTAGNVLYHGALTTAKNVAIDDQFKVAAGTLEINEA